MYRYTGQSDDVTQMPHNLNKLSYFRAGLQVLRRTMVLGSTQPLSEMSTRNISWGGGGERQPGRWADNLTTFMCRLSLKSGSLNHLEPSGLVHACNGIALPLPLTLHALKCDEHNRCTSLHISASIEGWWHSRSAETCSRLRYLLCSQIFTVQYLLPQNRALHVVMWKNMLVPDRP
jgi:hypothetical protein